MFLYISGMDSYCLDKNYVLCLLKMVFERAPASSFWENLFLDTKKSFGKASSIRFWWLMGKSA